MSAIVLILKFSEAHKIHAHLLDQFDQAWSDPDIP
jgi:hypothetical protein